MFSSNLFNFITGSNTRLDGAIHGSPMDGCMFSRKVYLTFWSTDDIQKVMLPWAHK
jgi:hypothetical protein